MRNIKITFGLLFLLVCMSCYSIRLKVANGQPEPADTEREDALSGLMVREMDTIVTVQTLTDESPINIRNCESGALHTIEYKSTFGGILLYLVTFGRKRTVKVKYVCIKESN